MSGLFLHVHGVLARFEQVRYAGVRAPWTRILGSPTRLIVGSQMFRANHEPSRTRRLGVETGYRPVRRRVDCSTQGVLARTEEWVE